MTFNVSRENRTDPPTKPRRCNFSFVGEKVDERRPQARLRQYRPKLIPKRFGKSAEWGPRDHCRACKHNELLRGYVARSEISIGKTAPSCEIICHRLYKKYEILYIKLRDRKYLGRNSSRIVWERDLTISNLNLSRFLFLRINNRYFR